jgi:hypothetical protein
LHFCLAGQLRLVQLLAVKVVNFLTAINTPEGTFAFEQKVVEIYREAGRTLLDLKQAFILRIFVPGRDFEPGRTVHRQSVQTAGEELFGVGHGRGPFLRLLP